jgi:hypothetical protein
MGNTITSLGQYKSIGMPYLEGAACTGCPNTMDGNNTHDVMTGLGVCRACPVLQQCCDWVASLGPRDRRSVLSGVVAGRVWGESKRHLSIRDRLLYGGVCDGR